MKRKLKISRFPKGERTPKLRHSEGKRGLNIQINFTNRFLYTFIAFIVLLIIGIGFFALTPGVAPNPGHLIDNVAPPAGCGTNQVLQWDGTNWICADFSSGLWTASGSNIYYNLGSIGIGTSTPSVALDVVGDIISSGTVCDGNGCIGSGGGINNCQVCIQCGHHDEEGTYVWVDGPITCTTSGWSAFSSINTGGDEESGGVRCRVSIDCS